MLPHFHLQGSVRYLHLRGPEAVGGPVLPDDLSWCLAHLLEDVDEKLLLRRYLINIHILVFVLPTYIYTLVLVNELQLPCISWSICTEYEMLVYFSQLRDLL
jgi:hypothetical protein